MCEIKNFVDHESAKRRFQLITSDSSLRPSCAWLTLVGGHNTGKTAFSKEIIKNSKSVYVCPGVEANYALAFIEALCTKYPKDFLRWSLDFLGFESAVEKEILGSLRLQYRTQVGEAELALLNRILVRRDLKNQEYIYAHFLSRELEKIRIKYFVLDDFHLCDDCSYNWILEFLHISYQPKANVIAVCNFEKQWISSKVKNLFQNISPSIEIGTFDSPAAYYEVLRNEVRFSNDIYLWYLAEDLYRLLGGKSQELFETIRMCKIDTKQTDQEKRTCIFQTAVRLHGHFLDGLNRLHQLILGFLVISPVPLSNNALNRLCGWNDLDITNKIIFQLFDKRLINQSVDVQDAEIKYAIADDYLQNLIHKLLSDNTKFVCAVKLYRAVKNGELACTDKSKLDLAIQSEDQDALCLIEGMLSDPDCSLSKECQAEYVMQILESFNQLPKCSMLYSTEIAKMLYGYGHYKSAQLVMQTLNLSGYSFSFSEQLLWGDIQHVLLQPGTSLIYEKAYNMSDIGVSERLTALNRQIMALNQEHEEEKAAILYRETLDKYEQHRCKGLLELYRNSNNSFSYNEAINYTIKGYYLAKELNDELEKYKCLHNICMLLLLNGNYGKSNVVDESLGFTPYFEAVLEFFEGKPEYRHERAYPLLDLGTFQMFQFVESSDREHLLQAKNYYSQAQLFAKSFYSQHIAETGLLVVNSYLFASEDPNYIRELRTQTFKRYHRQSDSIVDYRVHRKILLSLAVSALIANVQNEAIGYLNLARPYVTGCEVLRFNKLCQKVGRNDLKKAPVPLYGKNPVYYGSDQFVPWLISLCH